MKPLLTTTLLVSISLMGYQILADTKTDMHERNDMAAEVMLSDFVGRVLVKNGDSLSYEIEQGVPGLRLEVTAEHHKDGDMDSLVIDGGAKKGPKQCNSRNGHIKMKMRGDKMRPLTDFPTLHLTLPEDTYLSAKIKGGLFAGASGTGKTSLAADFHSVDFAFAGCGDAYLGDIAHASELRLAGSGDIKAKSIGGGLVDIAGSGDIEIGQIKGEFEGQVAGSGDMSIGSVSGDMVLAVAGSGDIMIAEQTGNADMSVAGSGDILVKDGDGDKVTANVAGSGDIVYRGSAASPKGRVAGSGDILIAGLSCDRRGCNVRD